MEAFRKRCPTCDGKGAYKQWPAYGTSGPKAVTCGTCMGEGCVLSDGAVSDWAVTQSAG